jgi:excisionase family DNA binding protein
MKPANLRLTEAARYMGISRSKLNELARSGEVGRFKLGSTYRYRVEDLDRFTNSIAMKHLPTYLQTQKRDQLLRVDPLFTLPIFRGVERRLPRPIQYRYETRNAGLTSSGW